VLDRQHDLERPQLKNFFSRRGQTWLQNVQLPCPEDQPLLEQDLEVAELLEQKIKQLDRLIGQTQSQEEKLLESIPGIGPLFSSVIATEIDGIARFNSPAKLAAYAGVLPTTHASGGRVFNGRLLWQCNKWLRWALIESELERGPVQRLLWRALPMRSRARQKQKRRHNHGSPSDGENNLAVTERATALH